jgi:hypothetical protein
MQCGCTHISLALEELELDDRIALPNSLLEQVSTGEVRVAVNDPESLGLIAEARLIGLTRSDEMTPLSFCGSSEAARHGRQGRASG